MNWVENGVKPAGDEVLTPAAIADPKYGATSPSRRAPGMRPCTHLASRLSRLNSLLLADGSCLGPSFWFGRHVIETGSDLGSVAALANFRLGPRLDPTWTQVEESRL